MNEVNTVPNALLIFTIGPVQDFIAAARRTQDLWMGSYILAYLSYQAMKEANKQLKPHGGGVVYPVLENHPFVAADSGTLSSDQKRQLPLATLPNRFTAAVPDIDTGRKVAQLAEHAVFEAWREVAEAVRSRFRACLKTDAVGMQYWDSVWAEQTEPTQWMEIYWTVYPSQTPEYDKLVRHAEQSLGARKALRNFTKATALGEKDTITGDRAALSTAANMPRPKLREEWDSIAKRLYELSEGKAKEYKGLSAALTRDGAERLSAISTTKRFAQRFFFENRDKWGLRGGFPSTSSIASVIFRHDLLHYNAEHPGSNVSNKLENFLNVLQQDPPIPQTMAEKSFPPLNKAFHSELLTYDGDLFFRETYVLKRLQDDYNFEGSREDVRRKRKALNDLLAAAKNAGIDAPVKYYALLLMDGDHMGKILSCAKSVEQHQLISRRLLKFALERVHGIVEDKYLGRVVYAGGDDLMAFLPIQHVLAAAQELNLAYREVMEELVTKGIVVKTPACSAGIAIAHHLAPLDGVLDAARHAEKTAKNEEKYGRDSVVFTVLKRSGEQLDVGAHWQYQVDNASVDTLDLIQRLYKLFAARALGKEASAALSARFAYEAEQEALALTHLPANAYGYSLGRLLKRHSTNLYSGDVPPLAKELENLSSGLRQQFSDAGSANSPTVETARWLLLARFLAAVQIGEEE